MHAQGWIFLDRGSLEQLVLPICASTFLSALGHVDDASQDYRRASTCLRLPGPKCAFPEDWLLATHHSEIFIGRGRQSMARRKNLRNMLARVLSVFVA